MARAQGWGLLSRLAGAARPSSIARDPTDSRVGVLGLESLGESTLASEVGFIGGTSAETPLPVHPAIVVGGTGTRFDELVIEAATASSDAEPSGRDVSAGMHTTQHGSGFVFDRKNRDEHRPRRALILVLATSHLRRPHGHHRPHELDSVSAKRSAVHIAPERLQKER